MANFLKPDTQRKDHKRIDKFSHNCRVLCCLFSVCCQGGALVAADTRSGEISTGTIQAIASKPIHRAQIIIGKWLVFAALLPIYTWPMAFGVMGSSWLQSGLMVPNAIIGTALIYLECLLFMTMTMAFSSVLSTLASGSAVFGL